MHASLLASPIGSMPVDAFIAARRSSMASLETDPADAAKAKTSGKDDDAKMAGPVPVQLRLDLWEKSALDLLAAAIQKHGAQSAEVAEAATGAILNLSVDVSHGQAGHMELKRDTGEKLSFYLTLVDKWIKTEERQRAARHLVARMLALFASMVCNQEAAVYLYRNQVHRTAMHWMSVYSAEVNVQKAGSAFLKNIASSQLRIRDAIVGEGGITQLAKVLKAFSADPPLIVDVLPALQSLIANEACVKEVRQCGLVSLTFAVATLHPDSSSVQASACALLLCLAAIPPLARQIVAQRGVKLSLEIVSRFRDDPSVIVPAMGLLRNLLVGFDAKQAEQELEAEGGFRTMFGVLWLHGLPGVGVASQAVTRASRLHHTPTPEGTAVVEQVFAALNNVAGMDASSGPRNLANAMLEKKRIRKMRLVLELHPASPMLQHQGFLCISRIVSLSREARQQFSGFAVHVIKMLEQHHRTPVSDIGGLLLEQVG